MPAGKSTVAAAGGLRAGALRGASRRRARTWLQRERGSGAGAGRLDVAEDVLAGDPAAAAGTGDLRGLQAVLAEQAPDRGGHAGIGIAVVVRAGADRDRRRGGRCGRGCGGGSRGGRSGALRALVGAGGSAGGCLRRIQVGGLDGDGALGGGVGRLLEGDGGRSLGAAGEGLVLGLDDRDLGVVGDDRAFLGEDLLEHAGERRWDLGVNLVGDDLEERLVLGDRVTGLLEPAPDRPLRDALAELGHRHLGHCDLFLRCAWRVPVAPPSVAHRAGACRPDQAVVREHTRCRRVAGSRPRSGRPRRPPG